MNNWIAGVVYGCVVCLIINMALVYLATGKPFNIGKFAFNLFFYSIGLIVFMASVPISFLTDIYIPTNT